MKSIFGFAASEASEASEAAKSATRFVVGDRLTTEQRKFSEANKEELKKTETILDKIAKELKVAEAELKTKNKSL